jgi:hypothetical protein
MYTIIPKTNYIRIDTDAYKRASELADFLERNGCIVTQITIYPVTEQAAIFVHNCGDEYHQILKKNVNNFLKNEKK